MACSPTLEQQAQAERGAMRIAVPDLVTNSYFPALAAEGLRD
jgi:hypothetical protein